MKEKQTMTYTELKAKQSKEINDFPLGAAVTLQSFEKMMKKWGLTTSKEDCKKILSLGCGCYIRKADEADFDRLTEKHQQERVEFLATDEGLKDALQYEFGNQECGYTWIFEDGIKALGFNVKKFLANKHKAKVYEEAKQEYINKMEN